MCDAVCGGADYYLLANDFDSYRRAAPRGRGVRRPGALEQDVHLVRRGSGKFSSDRTIREYAEDIWDVKPCKRPMTKSNAPPKHFGEAEKM